MKTIGATCLLGGEEDAQAVIRQARRRQRRRQFVTGVVAMQMGRSRIRQTYTWD